jgi:hypothetical protein
MGVLTIRAGAQTANATNPAQRIASPASRTTGKRTALGSRHADIETERIERGASGHHPLRRIQVILAAERIPPVA